MSSVSSALTCFFTCAWNLEFCLLETGSSGTFVDAFRGLFFERASGFGIESAASFSTVGLADLDLEFSNLRTARWPPVDFEAIGDFSCVCFVFFSVGVGDLPLSSLVAVLVVPSCDVGRTPVRVFAALADFLSSGVFFPSGLVDLTRGGSRGFISTSLTFTLLVTLVESTAVAGGWTEGGGDVGLGDIDLGLPGTPDST